MISDEMREILSAYVDGELRAKDVGRIEEMIKGDPALRREVDAYRRVGKSLRRWDAAENQGEPTPAMAARVLARLRTAERAAAPRRPFPLLALLTHPLSLAAGLLLAFGLGLLFAREKPAEPVAAPELLADAAKRDLPKLALEPWTIPEAPVTAAAPALLDAGSVIRENLGLSDRALALRAQWEEEETRWEEVRSRRSASGAETVTLAMNPRVAALLAGYRVEMAPIEALVLLRHDPSEHAPSVAPLPLDARVGRDHFSTPGRVEIRCEQPTLALLGEVLVAEGDGVQRARIVSASSWISRNEFAAVTWANELAAPEGGYLGALVAQPVVLGPRARRRLLDARDGRDDEFLAWLQETFRARPLRECLAERATERDRIVARMMRAIDADASATGFCVLSGGRLLGVEVFASHDLLRRFAPRLLAGYVLENGTKDLRLEAPDEGAPALLAMARKLIDEAPERTARLDEVESRGTEAEWPEGLRRVVLRDGVGAPVGYGLLNGDEPLHLTLFE